MTKEKVAAQYMLPPGLMDAKFDVIGETHDRLVARLTAYVLTDTLAADTVEESTEVPDTWWDHLKYDVRYLSFGRGWIWQPARWFINHLKKPKMRKITLTATWTRKDTRPESRIGFPKDLGRVVFQAAVSYRLDQGPIGFAEEFGV